MGPGNGVEKCYGYEADDWDEARQTSIFGISFC